METMNVQVTVRETTGKKATKAIRKEGHVPANLYGLDKPPVGISVDPKDLHLAVMTPHKMRTILKVNTGAEETLALIKEVQIDPINRKPVHVDLMRVTEDSVVELEIPVKIVGTSVGVAKGGFLELLRRTVKLEMAIKDIPEDLKVDVTELEVSDQKRIKDLIIPDGCKPCFKDNYAVIEIKSSRSVAELDEPGEEGEEEGTEGAEGSAADGDGEKKEPAAE